MSQRKSYPTDVTDAEWQRLEPLIPAPKPGGRPARYPRREIVNAIVYVLVSGCAGRLLPHDFPPLGNRVSRLPPLAAGRHLGKGPRPPAWRLAAGLGPPPPAQRRRPGQPAH